MAAHYSIFYASIRKVTQEKLSLGLLLFDDNAVYFKFSSRKLNGLKAFLSKEDYQLIHHSINAVSKKIQGVKNPLLRDSNELTKIMDSAFSINYISYLSRYKNNLVTYSEPKLIEVDPTPENALKLYENFIELEVLQDAKISKPTLIQQLTLKFDGLIDKFFNYNYTITNERVPHLIVPVKVDLLGKNGIDVLVRTIDTSNGLERITNEVSTFYLLKDAYKRSRTPVKDFLVAEEPLHKLRKQHDIWVQLKNSGDFTYLDLSEAEKLKEYAIHNHVKPVIDATNIETDEIPF